MTDAEFDGKVREAQAKLAADMQEARRERRCGSTEVLIKYQHGAVLTMTVSPSRIFK